VRKSVRFLLTILALALLAFTGSSCSSKAIRKDTRGNHGLVSTYCTSCHRRPDPAAHTDSGWAAIMEGHRDRLKLSEEKYTKILEHLTRSN